MMDFKEQFKALTGNEPFPWQEALYQRFQKGEIPASCALPTGLGKTNVIAIWLIAFANGLKVPRRLVYVVNRRTVVDQTTTEAEKLRDRAHEIGIPNLAISTLRGQYADNQEWSEDPSRPATICGTVDMIGSRLLFSGYGIGMKARPLHAGFLGQDVLLVHDEAHLEPAFQVLIEKLQEEQLREKDVPWAKFRVMELTATRRSGGEPFALTNEEKNAPTPLPTQPMTEAEKTNTPPIHHVWWRLHSKKWLEFKSASRDSVAKNIGEIARDKWKHSGKAILVFVRTIDSVKNVVTVLTDKQKGVPADQVQILTGTLRGYERDRVANPRREDGCPIFARFLPKPKAGAPENEQWKTNPKEGTVFLVCTSAGEVGVDISADHLVCDLAPLDSMAQRFGRVNRRGQGDAQVDVIYEKDPDPKRKDDGFEKTRWITKGLLERITTVENRHSVSPQSLIDLKLSNEERDSAFTPPPTILPATDILFDAWALTTIRGKLPGRPPVEPYLHGLPTEWQPPETHVAWREEVSRLNGKPWKEMPEAEFNDFVTELLDVYPLKPHELLKDQSKRVFDLLKKLPKSPDTPVWLQSQDGAVERSTLGAITQGDAEDIQYLTIIMPPEAGGLNRQGMLDDKANETVADVADEWFQEPHIRSAATCPTPHCRASRTGAASFS
jgi:CRISPR-associated endonuclease/helicase Cas3